MPADILRDREPAEAPSFATLTAAAPPDLSTRMAENDAAMKVAREKQARAREDERAAMQTRASSVAPQIAAVEMAQNERERLAAERPAPVAITPPPSRKISDFLAPVEGQSPENAISSLMQGIGLLAGGFTGMRRGNATTALASLAGALKGWKEGDAERGNRAFLDWQAHTDAVLTQHKDLLASYDKIMQDADTSVAQKMELLKLRALESGHQAAIATFDRQNADEDVKFLQSERKQLDTLEDHRLKLIAMADARRQHDEYMLETRRIAAQQKADKRSAVLDAYDDAAIEALAYKTLEQGGKVPSVGYGEAGQIVRGKVMEKLAEIAKKNNIPLSSIPAIGQEMKGWQAEITKAAGQLAYWQANIGTFHDHIKQFLSIADTVDRSGRPVLNRAILKARGQYAGDADVAAYEALANEVAMEYAKLAVGTAQGDANSREEARQKINTSLNQPQIHRVMEELVKAGENRKRNWENTMKKGVEMVSTFGGRITAPLPPGSAETKPPDLIWDAQRGGIVPVPHGR